MKVSLLFGALLPLFAATAHAVDSAVIFNEINYHPADEINQTEWIELRSLHGVDIDISGWQISSSPSYTFPEGTILTGRGFLVVAKTPAQIPGAVGPWTGNLSNSGQTLQLINKAGRLMDELDYADNGDWPSGPDGSGTTLSRRNQLAANSGASAWTSSNQFGGTPGGSNFTDAESDAVKTRVVSVNSTWKFTDAVSAPPSTWKDASFNDTAWAGGPGLLYAGSAKMADPLPPVTTLSEPGVQMHGYWAFQEASGVTTAANSVAGGTAGTLTGGTTKVDFVIDATRGQVIKLNIDATPANTTGGYVSAGSLPAMDVNNNFTWAFWSKTTLAATTSTMLGNRYSTAGATEFSPREFIKFTNQTFEWHWNGAGQNLDYADLSGTPAAPSAWIHHVLIKQGTTLTYYRNGVLANTSGISGTPANAQPFFMGGNGTNESWSGYLDDVALWKRALPPAVIPGLYSGTYTPLTVPTVSTTSVPVGVLPADVVFQQTSTTALSDDFSGATVDSAKWTQENMGLESTAATSITATQSGGKLTIAGVSPINYWAGKSLKSVQRFSTRTKFSITVDRDSLAKSGDLTPAAPVTRSSLWLYADATHYLHFAHAFGEAGWAYNWSDVGGTGNVSAIGTGVNLTTLDAFDNELGACQMKLVFTPGTYVGWGTVEMYRNGLLAGSQSFTNLPADFAVVLTGQCRKANDAVTVVFDNLQVQKFAPVTLQTPMALGSTAHYFRNTFNYAGDPARTTLAMFPLVDDGAVFYLNGQEIYRQNMPAGTVTHTTPASSTVADALFPTTAVPIPATALVNGTNVLAVEVHQDSAASPDVLFGAQLTATEVPQAPIDQTPTLVFNEIAAAADVSWQIELANLGASALNLAGYQIRTSGGQSYTIPSGTLAAGGTLAISGATLGLLHANGDRLYIVAPDNRTLLDSKAITNSLRGRTAGGVWGHPNAATFGAANTFTVHNEIVINEFMRRAPGTSAEQWVEIYNKSGAAVDLAGWHFSDGIDFTFPVGAASILGAGQYAVIVWDVAAFNLLHPGVAKVFGPFSGSLKKDETIVLRDADDNVADELTYHDSGSWPEFASGSASTYELRNPNADNAIGEAWQESNETSKGVWQNVSYDFSGANLETDPLFYGEFITGLNNDGEVLIDDIHVIEDPLGTPAELIQPGAGDFTSTTKWRFEGNHRRSVVMADPDNGSNSVLRIVSGGYTEHMSNHCETSLLKSGGSLPFLLDTTKTYRITFRARWWKGNNLLNTRLYFNRGAKTTALTMPSTGGTPGAQNSVFVANAGPTFANMVHSPAVPAASAPVTVTVRASDSDGIASASLVYSINEGANQTVAMTLSNGVYTGTIPAQAASAKANYFVQATDTLGAIATYPATGLLGRAIVPWDDGQARLVLTTGVKPHNVRVVMTAADTALLHNVNNVMSNDWMPCTVIYDERDVYYGTKVRLKGSEHGRAKAVRVGFFLLFPTDNLFLGVTPEVSIDRSGAGDQTSQKEILVKHTLNHDGMRSTEDDLIRVITPQSANTGPAIFNKCKMDGDNWLDGQFSSGSDGTMFEYELIYPLANGTTPPATDNGTYEGHKLTQDSPSPTGVPVRSLQGGNPVAAVSVNKDEYRWHWLIKNNRTGDDYSRLVPTVTALGKTGDTFFTEADPLVDMNDWMRAFAGPIAWGVSDNYASGSQHNMLLYFRPSDGKGLYIPWDMDFTASGGSNASITGNSELQKMIGIAGAPTLPANISKAAANKRAYYNYLLGVCNTSLNLNYQSRWMTHYSKFLNEDLSAQFTSFVSAREAYVRGQVAAGIPYVPFQITTATGGTPGADFSTGASSVVLAGDAWINLSALLVNGNPVALTWTDADSWTINLPIYFGTNSFALQALDNLGNLIGTDSIIITGTSAIVPADATNTAVSELMYQPATGGLEFIELVNVSLNTIDLSNCYYSNGIEYTYPAGTQVPPGGRITISQGTYIGAFNNATEVVELRGANGAVIFNFTYPNTIVSTRGGGKSLVRMLSSTTPNLATYQWRASTANGGNPGTSDSIPFIGVPTADADSDGWTALEEYAAGTSDSNPSSHPSAITNPIINPPTFSFSYDRRSGTDDVVFELKTSTDLSVWLDPAFGQSAIQDTAPVSLGGGLERITVGPVTYPDTGSRLFWRLGVRPR